MESLRENQRMQETSLRHPAVLLNHSCDAPDPACYLSIQARVAFLIAFSFGSIAVKHPLW